MTPVLLMLGLASGAFASLGSVGPTYPLNGFPAWYTDENDLKLDLCLDPAFCFFSPPIPGDPFSQQIGFGDEAFWWGAETTVAIVGGNEGLLVMALEAAFLSGPPVDGEQVAFARIRIRVDCPVAGTYTVTHPFGVEVFDVTQPGDNAINFTEDVGGAVPGDFTTALGGRIGPFLEAVNPPPPAGFVGDVNILQTVTGSPFGTNLFRIDGPPGSNLDGNGNDFVTTDLFNLQGRIRDPLSASGTTRELQHGSALWRQLETLPGGVPRDDWFKVAQRAHASYEVIVDATTGDVGDGGPRLERVASNGVTTVQNSVPAGAGGSRSLRWENALSSDVYDQYVLLRSAGCTSNCTPEDGCRIRLFDTTAGVARFNNSSSQSSVLVLQNTGGGAVSGHAWFWDGAGGLLGAHPFTLAPRAALVLPTASVPGVSGAAGSITVSHDGSFGQLDGKAVALEPATGFTFDTPLLSRPR